MSSSLLKILINKFSDKLELMIVMIIIENPHQQIFRQVRIVNQTSEVDEARYSSIAPLQPINDMFRIEGNVIDIGDHRHHHVTGCFFTGPPPEKLKYGKVRLGEVRCI